MDTPVLADAFSWFRTGGWVMYPLLALSLTSVSLIVERSVYWIRTHGGGRGRRASKIAERACAGRLDEAAAIAESGDDVYAEFATGLIERAKQTRDRSVVEAAAQDLAEGSRHSVERFGTVLSTIVTAAPMLGILGTVTGIIRSFRLLDASEAAVDPSAVASGIAEALLTTAFGLMVALITLFPYALFRAQADRCYGRIEAIAAGVAAAVGSREELSARKGHDAA
ncbi:MAG: MotA/TolQ/ExbB proton channel family protein [Planctomycetota bacterium]